MRAAVCCLVFVCACRAYDDLPLLEIGEIEPSVIEPGSTLRIHGDGFPLGQTPRIVLRGKAHRPGMQEASIQAQLAGVVQSGSLIEAPVDASWIAALGGRATVDAKLRVSFSTPDGHRDVFAEKRARLDFMPDTPTQLRAQNARQERTNPRPKESRAFGIELSREELGTPGVRVSSVEPDSLAARQGIEPGDRVMGLDGIRVYAWRDFAPDPSKSVSTVFVARDGLRGIHALRWPHPVTEPRSDPVALALFVVLGLGLGWLSPAALGVRLRWSMVPRASWLTRGVLVLLFASMLTLVSSLQWTTMWIMVLGTFAALFTLLTKDRAGAPSFSLAVVSTVIVMLIARTASIEAIIEAQRPAVVDWYLFQSPASFLAFGAYVHALGVICARPRLGTSLYAAAAAVLGAALFLGGMPLDDAVPGIGASFCKAAAILWASHMFRATTQAAIAMGAAGLGLALLGFFVDWHALIPHWSALAVGCVCALLARALSLPSRRTSVPVAV